MANEHNGNRAVRRAKAMAKAGFSELKSHKKVVGVRCRKCFEVKRIELRNVKGCIRVYGAFDLTQATSGK